MKKIAIQLNTKSINDARKYLLNLKKNIPKMQQEFLEEVAKWIVKQADIYIDNADLGVSVKNELHRGWDYDKTSNGVKIINNANVERTVNGQNEIVPLAIIVEFGSGIVGKGQPHPQASTEGYEYNVPSGAKFLGGNWSFRQTMENLDLPKDSVDYAGSGEELVFITQGAKGVWYAYNAIVDARMELAKSGGGEIGKMWEDIKARYIK